MTIGERIRAIRKEKGMTQNDLAARLGVSQAMITQYETRQREPKKMETVRKIAAALEVSVDMILDKDVIGIMREEERFEQSVQHYINWLRSMNIALTTPNYEDNGEDKRAIIVDINKTPLDISRNIDDIMQLSKEHFKVLAKQLGGSVL